MRAGGHAADAHRFFPFLDLDLRDAGFLQQLDQFFDFSNVHAGNAPPWECLWFSTECRGCCGSSQAERASRQAAARTASS